MLALRGSPGSVSLHPVRRLQKLLRDLILSTPGRVYAELQARPAGTLLFIAVAAVLLEQLRAKWRACGGIWPLRWLLFRRSSGPTPCCICGREVNVYPPAPFCRLPPRGARCCHLPCALEVIDTKENAAKNCGGGSPGTSNARHLQDSFVTELKELINDSPELCKRREPSIRLCYEDKRLLRKDLVCLPTPSPPAATFAIEGIREIRIVSCALRALPQEIGHMHHLTSLVLMSTQLTSLPAEVGLMRGLEQVFLNGNFLRSLPDSFGELPVIRDVCVDANQLQAIPPFVSRDLKMLTAPGNLLTRAPEFALPPERLELHGNALKEIPRVQVDADWRHLKTFKAMSNKLRALPRHVVMEWRWLEYLNVADNCLTSLPQEIAQLSRLDSLFAYNNRLVSLPYGLIRGTRLKRCLLEGNPLSFEALSALVQDVGNSPMQTLALDDDQAFTLLTAGNGDAEPRMPLYLPPCISVGSLLHVEGSACCSGMYMKLARCSHLKRSADVAVEGGPDGKTSFSMKPASTLVVAFAASQGEPEWLGVLRTLAGPGNATQALQACPPPTHSVLDFLGVDAQAHGDARFAPLWRHLPFTEVREVPTNLAIPDFDVLCVCDARMRWYAEDAPAVERTLKKVCMRYDHVMFVGASMGGFGAMLHGAELADIVLTFGPQSLLGQATLRPPADKPQAHLDLSARLQTAVRRARERGCLVEVHCAADTHLEHGLALPLEDLALTVHPILPRAPFARIMDKSGVLWPILANALARLVTDASLVVDPIDAAYPEPGLPPRVCIARWGQDQVWRYWASRDDLLDLFWGTGAPPLPRPEDWFCTRCCSRNMKSNFFCRSCGRSCHTEEEWVLVPTVADEGTIRVANRGIYPNVGDWGCGKCGTANQSRDHRCYSCGRSLDDHRNVIVQ